MTTFALLIDRCGLSQREAAGFLSARLDTVKSWSSGRNPTPDGVITELRNLYATIDKAARDGLREIERLIEQMDEPDVIELGLSRSDDEARSLGFPCVGAHAAALGLMAALADLPVVIIPRGTTKSTAAAIKARSR